MESDLRTPGKASWADIYEATFMDRLIDDGIIDKTRIRNADAATLGELIVRHKEVIGQMPGSKSAGGPVGYGYEYAVGKIKSLLGYREPQDPREIGKIKETTNRVIEFLATQTSEKITGAIVCGSRADKNKRPTEKSDLDIYLYVDQKYREIWPWQDWEKMIENGLNLPFEVSICDVYDQDYFPAEKDDPEKLHKVPVWGWNPNAFFVVGEMELNGKKLKDDDATKYLSSKLSGPVMDEKRRKQLMHAENRIEELGEIYRRQSGLPSETSTEKQNMF